MTSFVKVPRDLYQYLVACTITLACDLGEPYSINSLTHAELMVYLDRAITIRDNPDIYDIKDTTNGPESDIESYRRRLT